MRMRTFFYIFSKLYKRDKRQSLSVDSCKKSGITSMSYDIAKKYVLTPRLSLMH